MILTIDVGTSSVRALLFDSSGHALPGIEARESYSVRTTSDGCSEDDPQAMVKRVERCIDSALAQAGPLASQIGAVAFDTLATTTLALDANGQPLTQLLTYADTRSAEDAALLRNTLNERDVHERTGCLLRPSYWPARIAWMRRARPQIWQATTRLMTIGEYLELCLFGQCRAGYSAASWTGLLDRKNLTWDAPLLDLLELPVEKLSPLVDQHAPLIGLLPAYAQRWPALRAIPWFPAIGDGAAANVGSGCTTPDRVALTVGTTGALRVVRPDVQQVPNGLWCYRVDGRRALLGGATSEGGNAYAWLRETMQLGTPGEVEHALTAMRPDAHGLTVLPFWAGERSPGWAGDVRATISGLALATTPLDLLRASLEAVAYRFALIAERLIEPTTGDTTRQPMLVASGGGLLGSPAWMQIIANVLGRPLSASAEPEATSRGAALLALEALDAIPSIEALPADLAETYTPDPDHHAIYRAAIERQQHLYDALIQH